MGTLEPALNNYSEDYQNYINQKILESPITLKDNPFFPDCTKVFEDK